MNMFAALRKADGGRFGVATSRDIHDRVAGVELATPPLDGCILPGVTRDSVLALARDHASGKSKIEGLPEKLTVSERPISMKEIKRTLHKDCQCCRKA